MLCTNCQRTYRSRVSIKFCPFCGKTYSHEYSAKLFLRSSKANRAIPQFSLDSVLARQLYDKVGARDFTAKLSFGGRDIAIILSIDKPSVIEVNAKLPVVETVSREQEVITAQMQKERREQIALARESK